VTSFGRADVQFGTATVPDASVRITYDAPEASLSATALAFGAQAAGTAGAAQRVTLTAAGTAPLAFRGARAGADFLVSDDCPAVIAAGAGCAIDVRFAGHRRPILGADARHRRRLAHRRAERGRHERPGARPALPERAWWRRGRSR